MAILAQILIVQARSANILSIHIPQKLQRSLRPNNFSWLQLSPKVSSIRRMSELPNQIKIGLTLLTSP